MTSSISNIPLLQRIFSFEVRTPQRLVQLAAVDSTFRETVTSYCVDLWAVFCSVPADTVKQHLNTPGGLCSQVLHKTVRKFAQRIMRYGTGEVAAAFLRSLREQRKPQHAVKTLTVAPATRSGTSSTLAANGRPITTSSCDDPNLDPAFLIAVAHECLIQQPASAICWLGSDMLYDHLAARNTNDPVGVLDALVRIFPEAVKRLRCDRDSHNMLDVALLAQNIAAVEFILFHLCSHDFFPSTACLLASPRERQVGRAGSRLGFGALPTAFLPAAINIHFDKNEHRNINRTVELVQMLQRFDRSCPGRGGLSNDGAALLAPAAAEATPGDRKHKKVNHRHRAVRSTTLLHLAASNFNVPLVKYMLQQCPPDKNPRAILYRGLGGNSALAEVCRQPAPVSFKHRVLKRAAQLETIQLLLDARKQALYATGNPSNEPLVTQHLIWAALQPMLRFPGCVGVEIPGALAVLELLLRNTTEEQLMRNPYVTSNMRTIYHVVASHRSLPLLKFLVKMLPPKFTQFCLTSQDGLRCSWHGPNFTPIETALFRGTQQFNIGRSQRIPRYLLALNSEVMARPHHIPFLKFMIDELKTTPRLRYTVQNIPVSGTCTILYLATWCAGDELLEVLKEVYPAIWNSAALIMEPFHASPIYGCPAYTGEWTALHVFAYRVLTGHLNTRKREKSYELLTAGLSPGERQRYLQCRGANPTGNNPFPNAPSFSTLRIVFEIGESVTAWHILSSAVLDQETCKIFHGIWRRMLIDGGEGLRKSAVVMRTHVADTAPLRPVVAEELYELVRRYLADDLEPLP